MPLTVEIWNTYTWFFYISTWPFLSSFTFVFPLSLPCVTFPLKSLIIYPFLFLQGYRLHKVPRSLSSWRGYSVVGCRVQLQVTNLTYVLLRRNVLWIKCFVFAYCFLQEQVDEHWGCMYLLTVSQVNNRSLVIPT